MNNLNPDIVNVLLLCMIFYVVLKCMVSIIDILEYLKGDDDE